MHLLSLQTVSGDDNPVSMDSTLTFWLVDINERGGNSVCSSELKSCRLIRSQLVQVEIVDDNTRQSKSTDHHTVTPDSDGVEEGEGGEVSFTILHNNSTPD